MVRRLLDGLYRASGALAALCILAIAVVVLAQVALNAASRTIGLITGTALGVTIPSYSDFTGFLLAAASFLALAHTLRAGEHIRVTLVTARLPKPLRRIVEVLALVAAFVATAYLVVYAGALVLESRAYGDLSSGMVAVPIWIPQSALLVGLTVLAVAVLDELQSTIRRGASSASAMEFGRETGGGDS